MRRSPLLVLPLLVLAGCAAAAPAPAPQLTQGSSPARVATAPLSPEELTFVERVVAIDPALGEQPERTIGRGENICADLRSGLPEGKVAANAGQLFELSVAQGARIAEAAQETLCAQPG